MTNLILELVEIILELVGTHFNKADAANVILDIMHSCAEFYQANQGKALDPALISPEKTV